MVRVSLKCLSRSVAIFGSAAALFLSGSPAMAVTVSGPDKFLQLSFTSDQNVEAGGFLTVPDGYPDARELRTQVEFGAGEQEFQAYGNYDGTPMGTPFVGVLYGLTTLNATQSVHSGTDKSTLHLVLGIDTTFSADVVGNEFTTAFADFASAYHGGDVFPDYYANGVTESDFIDQLLFEASLSDQYGATNYGTNLLFDFGSYLAEHNGALSDGGGMSLVAFSVGQGIGSGTVQALDVPVSGVPEPANWAMMVGGFGLVGAAMRRRKFVGSFA